MCSKWTTPVCGVCRSDETPARVSITSIRQEWRVAFDASNDESVKCQALTPTAPTKNTRSPFWWYHLAIRGLPGHRIFLAQAIIHVAVVAAWPVFCVIAMFDARRMHQSIEQESANKEQGLYFHLIGGTGGIRCNACGHEEGITSFLHWLGPEAKDTVTGFQCQACGRFDEVRNASLTTKERCRCGGGLSRDKVIFCPKCKSRDLRFLPGIIT